LKRGGQILRLPLEKKKEDKSGSSITAREGKKSVRLLKRERTRVLSGNMSQKGRSEDNQTTGQRGKKRGRRRLFSEKE